MENPRLSSKTVEHYTPPEVIERVVKLIGPIDFDPCSCPIANGRIGAKSYLSHSGLEMQWPRGSIFVNPPGGKLKGKSNQALWWRKSYGEWTVGNRDIVFLSFNLNLFQTCQRAVTNSKHPLHFPTCIPSERLCYLTKDVDGQLVPGENPTHPSAIIWLPDYNKWTIVQVRQKFQDCFGTLGFCHIP